MNDVTIILAAGASTRMGQPKAMLKWRGRTLLDWAVQTAMDAGSTPIVVCGSDDFGRSDVILNPDWERGMGTTIARGAAEAALRYDTGRIGIMNVDQPLISSDHLTVLFATCIGQTDAVATQYAQGFLGVPAVFAQRCSDVLQSLPDREGARGVLRGEQVFAGISNFVGVEFPGTLDVDTMEDWNRFLEAHE